MYLLSVIYQLLQICDTIPDLLYKARVNRSLFKTWRCFARSTRTGCYYYESKRNDEASGVTRMRNILAMLKFISKYAQFL